MATISQVTEAVYRSRFEDQMSAGAAAAAKSLRDLGSAVVETDTAVQKSGKTATQYVNQLDPVTKATNNLAREQRALADAQKKLAAEVAAGAKTQEVADRTLAAQQERVRKASEDLAAHQKANASATASMAGLGNTAKLTTRELQQLSPQLADIGVSLAGGMNPLLILIQQGPQIADAVGGIGRAFALLRAAITPTVAAVAAATVAIVGSTAVAESQERALANLSNRLRATRNDYQALASSVEAAARAAAGNSSISTADARSAGQIIAGQRNFNGSVGDLQGLVETANRLSIVMGSTVPEAAERLAIAFARPTEAARRMADEGLRTMDEGLLRSIQRFENQGNVAEAARLALDAYARASANVARTPLQVAIDNASQAFTRLWQVLRPVVDLLGSAMAQAVAFLVNRIAAMVAGIAELGRLLADSRVSRLLFGDGAPPAVAAPQQSPAELAARRAREANPAALQREDIQDRMAGYRAGLADPNVSPEQARAIRDAMRELQAQLEGMTPATEQMLRGLREQAQLATVAEGAARELAQAEQELDRAARAAGLGQATAAEHAEARRLVQQRLRDEMLNGLVVLNREITGQQDIAAAYGVSERAGREAEMRHRAMTEALRTEAETSDRYERLVATLTARYIAQADALRDVRDAQTLLQQGRQLEYIRAETAAIGLSAVARERELAALRERQRIVADDGDPTSPRGQQMIANAEDIAEATLNLQRQRDAFNELARIGEQAFDRIGAAITEAFVNGNGRAINFGNIAKAVFSEIIQAGIRLAVLNPVINSVFGQNRPTAFDLAGVAGGAGGGGFGGLGSISNLLGMGGGGFSGGLDSLGVASGLFGNGISPMAQGPTLSGLTLGETSISGLFGTGTASGALGSLGLAAAGFAAGSAIGGMIAGDSKNRQTNAMIGAGLGTILGGPIGGIVGGIGGGLIGPGKGFEGGDALLGINAAGLVDVTGYAGKGESGQAQAAVMEQAAQQAAALNAQLSALQLRFASPTSAGGFAAALGSGQSGNPRDIAGALGAFGVNGLDLTSANDNINRAIAQARAETLQDAMGVAQWVIQTYDVLGKIETPTSQWQQQIDALNTTFGDAIAKAREYGLATEGLAANQAKAIATIDAQREATILGGLAQQSRILGGFLASREVSSGSPETQFSAVQRQFQAALAAARSGTAETADLNAVVQSANTLLSANTAFYASGPQAAAVEAMVRSSIVSLGSSLELPGFVDVVAALDRASDRQADSEAATRAEIVALREEMRGIRLLIVAGRAA